MPSGVNHSVPSQKCGRKRSLARRRSRRSSLMALSSSAPPTRSPRSHIRTSRSFSSGSSAQAGSASAGRSSATLVSAPLARKERRMKVKAAIAWEPKTPLAVEEIDLDGPKQGECLVRFVASGVCHTDAYTMSGRDPSGLFPSVLGHEGGGVVEEVGPGVRSLAVGDHVIPLYIPECRECRFCTSRKTHLCSALLATQGQG